MKYSSLHPGDGFDCFKPPANLLVAVRRDEVLVTMSGQDDLRAVTHAELLDDPCKSSLVQSERVRQMKRSRLT